MVSCVDRAGKANIITLAWSMPTSFHPPMLAVSISPKRYSHQLIEETKEFVVNVPTMDILKETLICGRISGRGYDKFREAGLTPLPAKMVRPPIISECVAHLACKLRQKITAGDHTLFIGDVLTAYANERAFERGKVALKRVKPVYHVGGDDFVVLSPEVISPSI